MRKLPLLLLLLFVGVVTPFKVPPPGAISAMQNSPDANPTIWPAVKAQGLRPTELTPSRKETVHAKDSRRARDFTAEDAKPRHPLSARPDTTEP
jgi:hypothetical protein